MSEKEKVKYSVVFLLDKKNSDFPGYFKNVVDVFFERHESFEIIIVANGTGSFLLKMIKGNSIFNNNIRTIEMDSKTTPAICVKSVLKEINGEYLVAFGSFQQITGKSISNILDEIDDKVDIISPWRQNRFDPFFYKAQSDMFNALVRWITGTKLHDLSCNVSVYRREVIEKTELYGNMYRFLPIYAAQKGFKCKEVECEHFREHGEPRSARAGFYYLTVYLNRIIDIFTLYFNTSFSRKPLRFFISIGFLSMIISMLIIISIFIQKIIYGYPVGDSYLLLLSNIFMVIGVQSASVGLLGEFIVFTYGRKKKEYVIEKII